jgi:membrane-associated phospholipid phosphatase
MSWLKALTELGDTAVLAPLAAVMLLWLLLMRSPGGAVWWAIAVVSCAGLTAILKISFFGCPPTAHLHSPSGHTSFSTLVYGAMALVPATESAGFRRILTISGSAGFILAIAASRLLLAHSAPEVLLGLMIGIASLTIFGQGYLRCRAARVWLSPLLVAGGAVVLAVHGRELDAERLFQAIARYLRIHCI